MRRMHTIRPRHRWAWALAWTLLVGLVIDGPAAAAQRAAPIEALVHEFQAEHEVPGLVVGTLGPAGERVVEVGVTSRTDGVPVDRDTRFQIGSVTKVFTGLLLAEAVLRGAVELEASVASYLNGPAGANPALEGIRLFQLATHTSGLPRLPANLEPADLADPYADYDGDRLESLLAGIAPARAPGAAYEYSNLGTGLLGYLLARVAGKPFSELLHERLAGPLGLHDTFAPDAGPSSDRAGREARVAAGHSAAGEVRDWRFDALAGAGAMWSTAADLLRFLRLQLEPPTAEPGEAIRLSQQVHGEGPGELRMALGWHVVGLPDAGRLYFHNGGTGGFRSFVAFAPAVGVGIVVLANRDVPLAAIDAFGLQLLRAAVADAGG